MIPEIFMLRQLSPEVRIKKMAQGLQLRMEGQKAKKKAIRQLENIKPPSYNANK